MTDDDSTFAELLRRAARRAGRQVGEAASAYREGQTAASLPTDDEGRVRLVCRRHAEKRAVPLDDGVPVCFDPDHPACQGCAEDVREGRVETW
ncbi:DUF7091 family protein [Halospeciosus flavus]|uniref:Uncharacterized protein n=1 Tax=Halospeciosus flavus TaxID=3032283 RepID=A0ABD5Z7K8_9EURY|nr:hypothetical protein [Halospeciosus flavus]